MLEKHYEKVFNSSKHLQRGLSRASFDHEGQNLKTNVEVSELLQKKRELMYNVHTV